ncbi:F-box protein At3g07870-like [Carica papaya]|uniref:F-box protein At3g07870-like n=1 Tax=Carica papaya TaxID=3649 RepID=UPI000B8CF8D0|nr:F-box protein At3g07870-like [Carica papaya]
MGSEVFPDDLLTEILVRLPVKSLVRFTLVSRSWRALVTSPTFVSIHLSQTKTLILLRLYSPAHNAEIYSIHFNTADFDLCQQLDFSFRASAQSRGFRIVGSCNGLLCLSDALGILVWNPIIRKSLSIPNSRGEEPENSRVLGFGFDSRSDDYKVIKLAYPQIPSLTMIFNNPPKVEVYSLNSRSWRSIDAVTPPGGFIESSRKQVFLNGAVHWVAMSDRHGYSIVSFNIADEVFDEMPLPEIRGSSSSPAYFSIALLGKHLSAFEYEGFAWSNSGVGLLSRGVSVWVMEKYGVVESWKKRFNVDFQQRLGSVVGMPLEIRGDSEILLATNDGRLILYSAQSHHAKDVGACGKVYSCYADRFVESLVLFENGID